MELYEKFLELIENGDMIFCNVKFAKNLEEIANKHYKNSSNTNVKVENNKCNKI